MDLIGITMIVQSLFVKNRDFGIFFFFNKNFDINSIPIFFMINWHSIGQRWVLGQSYLRPTRIFNF